MSNRRPVVRETVSLYDAKTRLSALVERAAEGEEIVISKSGKPKAKLVPLDDVRPLRTPGKGAVCGTSKTTSTHRSRPTLRPASTGARLEAPARHARPHLVGRGRRAPRQGDGRHPRCRPSVRERRECLGDRNQDLTRTAYHASTRCRGGGRIGVRRGPYSAAACGGCAGGYPGITGIRSTGC